MTVESARVASYWPPTTLVATEVWTSWGMTVIASLPADTHSWDSVLMYSSCAVPVCTPMVLPHGWAGSKPFGLPWATP